MAEQGEVPEEAGREAEGETGAKPFSEGELRRALLRPHRAIEVVLGAAGRHSASLEEGRNAPLLALLLLIVGAVFAIPMGALPPISCFWKIAALYTGSVLLCLPSFHVFSVYLGIRIAPEQSLSLALMISAVAACFSLGFAPIVWFIDLTSGHAAFAVVSTRHVALAFLSFALILAVARLIQCVAGMESSRGWGRVFRGLLAAWVSLFGFISYRMALVLDLL